MDWVRLENKAYWICFVSVFLAIAVWESLQPHRRLSTPAERRWKNHGVLLILTAAVAPLLFRVSPLAAAAMAAGNRYGLLNKPWAPLAIRCALTVALLDLLQYGIHWSMHRVSWLWRAHEVHHSDPDFDVSTAARFHPFEMLYSQGARLGAIALLSPPLVGVFIAELLTAALNLAVHANAALPRPLETALRAVFITPDLHRVHHSDDPGEQQLNYGQTFPWWDHLFGTYGSSERSAAAGFTTGLRGLENCDRLGLRFLLTEPFHSTGVSAPLTAVNGAPDPTPSHSPLPRG